MSDPMMGQPPMGGPERNTGEELKKSRSIFNPTDMAASVQDGQIDMNMPIRDFFAQKGVDVDGPLVQLVQFAKSEMNNADPMKKMQNLAGTQPSPNPLDGVAGGATPMPEGGGLSGLMG